MVKATARDVHRDFAHFLDLAHTGESIVITKRGKPWATLKPVQSAKPRKVDWNGVFERAREVSGGKKVEAVKTYLQMREEATW